MEDKWKVNRRSCSTIYTHPDIIYQVIVSNSGRIEWNDIDFVSVVDAKRYAEKVCL